MATRRRSAARLIGLLAVCAVAGALVIHFWGRDSSPDGGGPATGGWTPDGAGISVSEFGAEADDETDDTQAIQDAFDHAGATGRAVTFGLGVYDVDGTLEVPDALTDLQLADRTVLRQHGDPRFGTVSKQGSAGTRYDISATPRGAEQVHLHDTAGLEVGSWLVLSSDDSFSREKPMNPGMLRRVEALTGDIATLDLPTHRDLVTEPRAYQVVLAQPLRIRGGVLEHASPLDNFHPALTLQYVRDPLVDMEIRDHGSDGANVNGTVGGRLRLTVHDLVDDQAGKRFDSGRHYGYGVSAVGPTRDLVVRGTCWAVRHCFTTNAAYLVIDGRLRGYGDPENIRVPMDVHDTTSTGLDTHEPGWNITFVGSTVTDPGRYRADGSTDGKEGGGGIFVRARGTRIEDVTVIGAADDGITIAGPAPGSSPWSGADRPQIRNTEILEGRGKSGIQVYQPVIIQHETLISSDSQVAGIRLSDGAEGAIIAGVTIDLAGSDGLIGITNAESATISDATYLGVAVPTS